MPNPYEQLIDLANELEPDDDTNAARVALGFLYGMRLALLYGDLAADCVDRAERDGISFADTPGHAAYLQDSED